MTSNLIPEIRINSSYSQLIDSEYSNGNSEESVPTIRKIVKRTPFFLEKINKSLGKNNTILPSNCRYIDHFGNYTLVVIEEPPAYRTIKFSYGMQREIDILKAENKIAEWNVNELYYLDPSNMPFNFNLAFPYVIFAFVFDRYNSLQAGRAFLRTSKLTGFGDHLLKMPMTNIDTSQYVCFGDAAKGTSRSLTFAIEKTIMVFWSAIFNSDYAFNYRDYKSIPILNTYIGWQYLSQTNPMFIYNADWIKYNESLLQCISSIKSRFKNEGETRDIEYSTLRSIFTAPMETTSVSAEKKLYYDIAQSIYLDDKICLNVGDSITWGKKRVFIDSFIGYYECDKVEFIRFEREDGKLLTVKLIPRTKKIILDSIKNERFQQSGILRNGDVVYPNDIISLTLSTGQKIYKKITYIRKTVDGLTESRIGNSYYILENIDAEKESINKEITVSDGLKIKPKDKVIIVENSPLSYNRMISYGKLCEFNGIDVDNYDHLSFNFTNLTKGLDSFDKNVRIEYANLNITNKIYPVDNVTLIPPLFRVGCEILYVENNYNVKSEIECWKAPNKIVVAEVCMKRFPTLDKIMHYTIINNGNTFHIKSFDLDITFNVGDKVVFSDWKNPMNMLIPRTIVGFKGDKKSSTLSFILKDKNENLGEVPYIKILPSYCEIKVGSIRKIENSFGNLTSGSKIISKEKSIMNFPKKSVNIIIGFITDTGGDDPLVLCSNCCTLWYSTIAEKFDIVPIQSEKWQKLSHAAIDINKIKLQVGDIVYWQEGETDSPYILVSLTDKRSIYYTTFNMLNKQLPGYALKSSIKSNFILDYIPNPRSNKKDCETGWPNFHGLFKKDISLRSKFLVNGGK